MLPISFQLRPPIDNDRLNKLFAAAWPDHTATDFSYLAKHSLLWACAYHDDDLIGFVNLAWDGGVHGFLLDTTVHPTFQRQGIGVRLVQKAVESAREQGLEWVHVDYEAHLDGFYRQCGFRPTQAGLIKLRD